MMKMPMPMWFYGSSDVYFLFEGCESTTVGGLFLGASSQFSMAFLIQVFTHLKAKLPRTTVPPPADQESLKGSKEEILSLSTRLLLTAITGVQYAVSGFVMLLFMTFNTWVFLSIILGYTTGYFFFVSDSEISGKDKGHCH